MIDWASSLRAACFGSETESRGQNATGSAVGAARGSMDESEFTDFHRRTERPFWAYLMRLTGRAQAADDISQESYLRFLSRSELPADFKAQRSYLFKIGSRLVIDERRRSRFEGPWSEVEEPTVREKSETGMDVWRGLSALKPKERAMLWLAYVEQYSHDEIADILGLRSSSIRVLLSRARKRLSKVLAGLPSSTREGGIP